MKKIQITLILSLITLISKGQCTYTNLPETPTTFAVQENRPHTNPHLNWNTCQYACEYVVNAKIVNKQGNTTYEQQAAGYPFVVVNFPNQTSQDVFDGNALNLASLYKGAITIVYEVSSRNNVGQSAVIRSQTFKIVNK